MLDVAWTSREIDRAVDRFSRRLSRLLTRWQTNEPLKLIDIPGSWRCALPANSNAMGVIRDAGWLYRTEEVGIGFLVTMLTVGVVVAKGRFGAKRRNLRIHSTIESGAD